MAKRTTKKRPAKKAAAKKTVKKAAKAAKKAVKKAAKGSAKRPAAAGKKTVKAAKMFGLKAIWIGSKKSNVSDATKTIVDILNDPKLVGGMSIVYDIFKEYCESEYCDFQKLLDYCHKMENKTIFKRLGFMIDTKMAIIPKEINSIEKLISTGYSNFDPLIKKNHIIEKWKIKAPVSWVEEYDRKK